jgi:hypothetical protein
MQFIVFMIPGIYQPGKKIDPNFVPAADKMEQMGKFNAELQKAGAIVSLNGLHPLTKGARIRYAGGKPTVTDGPFVEAKEVVGGYWILEAKSKDQVVEWMKRCPAEAEDVIEIRPIFDLADLPVQVQQAAQKEARP